PPARRFDSCHPAVDALLALPPAPLPVLAAQTQVMLAIQPSLLGRGRAVPAALLTQITQHAHRLSPRNARRRWRGWGGTVWAMFSRRCAQRSSACTTTASRTVGIRTRAASTNRTATARPRGAVYWRRM